MSPYKRGGTWYVEVPAKLSPTGKRSRQASEARTEGEAKLLEAEMRVHGDRARKDLGPGVRNPQRLTLKKAAARYLLKMKGRGGYDSLAHTVAKYIDRSALGDLLLEHVTTAAIETFLASIVVKKRANGIVDEAAVPAPATLNRIRSCISGAFKTVKKLKLWHGDNPVADVEHRPEPEHHDRLIAPDRIKELVASAPDDDWRLVFALAAYAGLRRSDIARLDLDGHVDLEARVMTIVKGKDPRNAGRIRRVGVHRDLVPMIEAARARGLDLRARAWQNSAAQVKSALDADEAVFHGLRHTWASQMIECGARESVVEFMGWGRRKSSTFRKHYLDFPNARLVAEIDRLVWPEPPDDEGELVFEAQTGHSPWARVAR